MEARGSGHMTGMSRLLKLKIRHDDPVDVHTVHADYPNCRATDAPWSSFCRLGQKEDEGDEEVPHNQKDRVPVPTAGIAVYEEPCFLWDVCIPLQEILAKRDISPERGEGEKEHSHDMIMFDREETLQVSRADKAIRDQNQNCHRGLGTTGKEVDSPHGGVPVVVH